MISYPREYPTSNRRDAPPLTYSVPISKQQSPYPQPLDPPIPNRKNTLSLMAGMAYS